MFNTCSDARALAHDAREYAKETRRIQNADRRAAGIVVADDPPALAAQEYVPIPMPPIYDDDFYFGVPPADVDDEDYEDGDYEGERNPEEEEEEYDEDVE